MTLKDVRFFLIHALECVEKVRQYTAEGKAAFLASPLVQDAVVRNFEILGEAVKNIPLEIRERYPAVP